MRIRVVCSAVLALVVGGQALAEGMSYNYLQGGLLASQVKKNGDSDGGFGYKFEGAISNNMPVYVFFNLAANKYPDASDNLRITNVSAGVGGHRALTSTLDVVGSISYENIDLKASVESTTPPPPGPAFDAYPPRGGLGYAAGLRGQFGSKVEWTAGIKYRDVKSSDSVLSLAVGGRYFIRPALALGVELTTQKYDMEFTDRNGLVIADLTDARETTVVAGVRYQCNDPW